MTQEKTYDKSAIEKLDAIVWSSIWPKLIKYAQAKEKFLIKVYSDLVYLDIVKEAIARIYGRGKNGKFRNWNSEKYPDVTEFLKYIMKDIVREEVSKKTGYTEEQLFWEKESGEEKSLNVSSDDDTTAHQLIDSENIMIDEEKSKILSDSLDELAKKLNEIADQDEELEAMILCIYDDKPKCAQIEKETGFDRSKVYNLRRKLKRKLEKELTETKDILLNN